MSSAPAGERVNNLDAVRLVAAAAVIYGHAFPLNLGTSPGFLSNSVQTIGVKIFFMLSGFLIAQSWDGDAHVGRFLLRRALRLFPGLALVLLFSAFVVGPIVTTLPLTEYFSNARLWSYLGNLNLNISYDLPGVFARNPYPTAVNGSLWSLPVEVLMYLLVPPLLFVGTLMRRTRAVMWASVLVAACLNVALVRLPLAPTRFVFHGVSLVSLLDVAPYFVIGMLAYVSGWRERLSAQGAAMALLIAILFPAGRPVVDELLLMCVIPVLVLGFGFSREPQFARGGRFGDLSYGLYLYGFVVQQFVTHLWGAAMPPWLNALISLLVSLALAFFSWHAVEKRALNLRPRTRTPSPAGAMTPDAEPENGSWRQALECCFAVLALNALMGLPWVVFGRPRDPLQLLRICVEVVAVVALVSTVPATWRRRATWLGAVALVGVLAFDLYDLGFRAGFQRDAAIAEDLPLALNGFHYLQELLGRGFWPTVAAAVALSALTLRGVAATISYGSRATSASPSRARWAWGALVVCAATGVLASDGPVAIRTTPTLLNLRRSAERNTRLRTSLLAAPDDRYRRFSEARLTRRPNVYLVMIEAYGQRLISDQAMRPAFEALLSRVETRLGEAGYHARTGTSEAPVFGGRSWLSIATVMTGIHIDSPGAFAVLVPVAAKAPSFVSYFRAQGYTVISAHPGNRDRGSDLPGDIYGGDTYLDGPSMDYRGPPYGWVRIPDQFALGHLRSRLNDVEGPFFSFYMSVSTHHPWLHVPYVDRWEGLQDGTARPVPASALEATASIPDGPQRSYFDAVEYEWRALTDFILSEASDDAIFILVGDHQPLLERSGDDARMDEEVAIARDLQSSNTLVHVISRDARFVSSFVELQQGLMCSPGSAALKHEGLFSTFLSRLVEHHGDPATRDNVTALPDGLNLAGLLWLPP